MMRLHEPFNLQINLGIRFLNSAWNVLTPTLQNSSLALLHLDFFKQYTQSTIIGNLELLDARLFELDPLGGSIQMSAICFKQAYLNFI